MKFVIKGKEVEKTSEIYLTQDDEEVDIMVKDPTGDSWFIGSISVKGELRLATSIGPASGLALDKKGKIKIATE